MKCNRGVDLVCYKYSQCKLASICDNVPRGIREKIGIEEQRKRNATRTKNACLK